MGTGEADQGPKGNEIEAESIYAGYVANVIHVYQQAAPGKPELSDEAFEKHLSAYLAWVPDFYGQARLFGGEPKRRDLREVFTPFTLRRFSMTRGVEALLDRETGDDAVERMKAYHRLSAAQRERGQPVPTRRLLLEGQRVAVVGGAGSGKSTLLAHLACELAAAIRGGSCAFDLPPKKGGREADLAPIPLLIPLRLRRQYLAECEKAPGRALDDATVGRLRGFIPWALGRQSEGLFRQVGDFVDRLLQGGAILLLLDGLDEVVDSVDRRNVRQEIENLASTFPKTRIIVTAREAGYRDRAVFPDSWNRLDVQPLDEKQVAFLVDRWCRELYPATETAQRNAKELTAAIQDLEHLRLVRDLSPLINSPLMVTMVVSVRFVENRPLPRDRARLYERCVEVLLQAQYQQDDKARDDLVEWGGPWDSQRDWLACLAHAMHRQGSAGAAITEEELRRILQPEVEGTGLDLARFITAIRQRGGLLEERGDLFQFLHLTFQEFLAARYIAKQREEGWADLDERLVDSWWRETLLLVHGFAQFDHARTANDYLRWLIKPDRPAELRIAGLELAGTALLERERIADTDRAAVVDSLATALFDPQLRLPTQHSRRRAAAGRTLSALGDPRPEVLHTAAMSFCWVPPGDFWMGSDESDKLGFGDERVDGTAHKVAMPDGYWMGQYPVTQAQFQEFLQSDDFGEERFWSVPGAGEWRDALRNGAVQQDNLPVVRINWYEALAYAQWATEQVREHLPAGWVLTLPSEAEWEKAARGGLQVPVQGAHIIRRVDEGLASAAAVQLHDQPLADAKRRYPWGDDPDPDRANYADSGVGSTSAVGCFPGGVSVYGCQDLTGNVWEWTRSEKRSYQYPEPGSKRDQLEDFTGGDARRRVLRGGAFHVNRRGARCAGRDHKNPYDRDLMVGFRLVASPFHSGR